MSQKKKGKELEGCKEKWNKEEDPLQAVVIADSFNTKFLPITAQKPRALLPLVNHTLLDYTIEYLIEEGVQEIILFCSSSAAQIKEYANNAKWSQNKSQCTIQTVTSSPEDCLSLGDALREIDRGGFIRSDFLLVPGDLVSNVKLLDVIQQHKTRRKKEKNSVMTMLYKTAKPGHFSRSHEEEMFIAMDTETQRILHCQAAPDNQKFNFPLGILTERDSVRIRYDLADCHIAICSPTVPPLFTDNFDYQSKKDFVRGILINEEIMGNQIHCHIIEEEYAARAADLHMYNAISLDIMNRWVYPLVPDNGSYRFTRHNVYLDKGIKLARDCQLEQDVVIGEGATIGTGSFVSKTVIGKNCEIGENVRISNSYIWDNVVIKDNCTIDYSIVCNDCVINRNVQMSDAVVSFKVRLGPDLTVESGSKFSLIKPSSLDDQFDDLSLEAEPESSGAEFQASQVGVEGCGYLWPNTDADDLDEEVELVSALRGELFESDEESSDDESVRSWTESPPPDAATLFYVEVLENIRSGISDNVAPDNIILEVNASKYKHNVTIREINQAVIKSLLDSVHEDRSRSKQSLVQNLEKIVTNFLPLVANYIKGNDSQMDCITAAEDFFVENPTFAGIFPTFLHKLYDKDILDEQIILKWYQTNPSVDPEMVAEYKKLRENELMKRFITWLQEAEEESEEDSD